jgi:hypothetical protein
MVDRRFVYGTFVWPGKDKQVAPTPRSGFAAIITVHELTGWETIAVEIIREYGANELIGKLYFNPTNQWIPIGPNTVERAEWYRWFQKLGPAARHNAKIFGFEMDGSGRWSVLHFRNESDETGPYVAVALRYSSG